MKLRDTDSSGYFADVAAKDAYSDSGTILSCALMPTLANCWSMSSSSW
jgi:hypothetical protein